MSVRNFIFYSTTQMKNVMKIGALSLALIASLLLLSNQTNAAAAPVAGNVSLDITVTSGQCRYGTSLYIGAHQSQYAAYDMTGYKFWSGTPTLFSCTDTEGLSYWNMTMQESGTLKDGVSSLHDIAANNVSMVAQTNYVVSGSCTAGINDNAWIAIGTNPGTILYKSGAIGDICTINSDYVNLAVHIDAHQAVGTYTGTLVLNMPF